MPTTLEVKTPRLVTAIPGPNAKRVLERDARFMSPSYTRDYPLVARRGRGAIVEDVDGNAFLDFAAGIAVCSTGHCHPQVVAAIQNQAAELIHMSGTDFYYESMPELAERLGRTMPGTESKKVFFTNSGTEAIESAIKLARYATRRDKFIAFYGCFHGRSMGALSLTASKSTQRKGFGALLSGIEHLPFPYAYRCAHGQTAEPCGAARGRRRGALIARASVMCWKPGSRGTTFGGTPVCIAAALATMDLIESDYKGNAHRMGDYLCGRRADWVKGFKVVGEVRGR